MDFSKQLKFITDLPTEIKESIEWYTGGNFDTLNENVRKGKALSKTQKKHFDNISKAFYMAPPLGGDTDYIVWKGKGSSRVYDDKSFISTSTRVEEALNFTNKECCLLMITISKGSKVLPLFSLSRMKEEKEVLLDREGKLVITGEEIKNIDDREMKVLYVTYLPKNSGSIKHIDKVVEKLDDDLIIERIVKFFEDEDDPDFIDDDTIEDLYRQITGDDMTKKELEKVKVRLNII